VNYLDNLATLSKQWETHFMVLRAIFEQCHKYKIHRNPSKCAFCIIIGHLLSFIVSKLVIIVDHLKLIIKCCYMFYIPFINFKTYKGNPNCCDGLLWITPLEFIVSCTYCTRVGNLYGMRNLNMLFTCQMVPLN
jgi:hypothetical protein